ncbi:PAS domain-containing protein [Algibacter sp. AS12]|uniref:PAS domain-containing protein n=1 Tax=Algibacter sp. AS12 TaxID=3135773 RepID=UPI00398AD304
MKLMKQEVWRDNPDSMLEAFLDNHTSISIIDIIGRIVYANHKFSELIEIPHHKIVGELNTILKSGRHANPIYKDIWSEIKNGGIWKGIITDYTSSGKLYRLDTMIVPGRNESGSIDKFVAFHFNDQANHDAKLKVISTETPNKTYYNCISNSVLSINAFAEIINSNQGFGKLCEKEVLGCNLYGFINPIFHNKVKQIIRNVFDNAKPDQFQTYGVNSEGEDVVFISQIGPVINTRGIVVSATISTQELKDFSKLSKDISLNIN